MFHPLLWVPLLGLLLFGPALLTLIALWFWVRGRRTWHYFVLNLIACTTTYLAIFARSEPDLMEVGLSFLLCLSTFFPPFVFRGLWVARAAVDRPSDEAASRNRAL